MTAMPIYREPTGVRPEYVACRGQRVHWMESIPVPAGEPRPGGVINVWWRCVRCGMERHDQLNPFSLANEGRHYYPPDGYAEAGEDRPTPATWRATYLRAVGVITDRQASAARRYRKELWEQDGADS